MIYVRQGHDRSAPSPFRVRVTGFTKLEDPLALIKFLRSKCTKAFFAENIQVEGAAEAVVFEVATKADSMALATLSGIRYYGEKLLISILDLEERAEMQTSESNSVAASKEQIIAFVEQSITPDKLVGYFDSAQFKLSSSLGLKVNLNQKHFANVFLDLIAELAPSLQALSLAENGLHSLAGFSQMWLKLPNLKTLNLEKNSIESPRELDNIEKIVNLRELILAGNPICSRHDYIRLIRLKFPNLQFLDRAPLPLGKVSAFGNPREYFGESGNFFDSPNTSQLVEQVFLKYFTLFDQSRLQLEGIYSAVSTFSFSSARYSAAHQAKTVPKIAGCRTGLYNQSDQFNPFDGQTRKGEGEICKFFLIMPQSVHRLGSMKFDCWMSAGGSRLNVFVNGEFEDSTGLVRLFTRSFLLVPSGEAVGWPVRIVNDVLTILRSSIKQ